MDLAEALALAILVMLAAMAWELLRWALDKIRSITKWLT